MPEDNETNNSKVKPDEMVSDEQRKQNREVVLPEKPDSEDFIYVLQNNFGATSAESENPVIKTFGLGGCTVLIIYDPDTKVASLSHISPSVLMIHKMQERAALQRRKSPGHDHLLGQMNKLFYALEDNNSQKAKYDNRGKLEVYLVCSYHKLGREIAQRLEWGNAQLPESNVFKQQNITAIAFDTRDGKLYKLTPPIKGNVSMSTIDAMRAQLGEIYPTKDHRSLIHEEF